MKLASALFAWLLVASIAMAGEPQGGLVLAGGGDLKEMFTWMIERSGGGDFVVLASSDKYTEIIREIGGVSSVETITIKSKDEANSEEIVKKIEEAEAVFLGGGNQADYVGNWMGTKLLAVLNSKLGKIPMGGVSAGMAVMGEFFYGAKPDPHEAVSSETLLNDPYDESVGVLDRGFMNAEVLKGTLTDTHYTIRKREGRHLAFMALLIEKFKLAEIKGIGVDEDTALCIDSEGKGQVIGDGCTFFLRATSKPEICTKKTPLKWETPIEVHVLRDGEDFSLVKWEGSGKIEHWSVDDGEFKRH